MIECFLLIAHGASARWAPFVAIPLVIAGTLVSMWLILCGVKGLCAGLFPRRSRAPYNSARVIQWISKDRPSLTGRRNSCRDLPAR